MTNTEENKVEELDQGKTESVERTDEETKVFTQSELEEILKERIAREQRKADKKVQDAVEEAKRYAKMTKDQKTEYENEKLQKELDELRKEKALNEMKDTARVAFKDLGIIATDELLNLVVTAEAETTKTNVESFSEILNEMVQAKVKEALRQDAPKNFKSTGITKQEIFEIKDDSQRQMAIAQNKHLFK